MLFRSVGTTGGTTGLSLVMGGFVGTMGSEVILVAADDVLVVDVCVGVVVPPVGSPPVGGVTPPGTAGEAAGSAAGSAAMGMKSPNVCAVTDVATSANTKRTSVDFFSSIFFGCAYMYMCVGCCYLSMVVG